MAKATKASLSGWIAQVEETIGAIEDQLSDCESDSRIEMLEARLEVWQSLLDAMETAREDLA